MLSEVTRCGGLESGVCFPWTTMVAKQPIRSDFIEKGFPERFWDVGNSNLGSVFLGRRWLLCNRYTGISLNRVSGGYSEVSNLISRSVCLRWECSTWNKWKQSECENPFLFSDERHNSNLILTYGYAYNDKSSAFWHYLWIFVGKREYCCLEGAQGRCRNAPSRSRIHRS